MRKVISALVVLALCLSLIPAALAETESTMTEAEVEAAAAQSGLEGSFVTLDALGLKLWLRDGLTAYTLPESVVVENGYVAYYMNNEQTSAVGITLNLYENPNIGREDIIIAVAANGVSEVELMNINDMSCLAYSYEVQEGLDCYVITVMLGDGYVAEFAFTAGDTAFANAKALMARSIMSAE